MFPLNEKIHGMDMRNREKFKVQHAKTNRLKNSAIVYMQKLLNDQNWESKWQMTGPPLNLHTGWIFVYI